MRGLLCLVAAGMALAGLTLAGEMERGNAAARQFCAGLDIPAVSDCEFDSQWAGTRGHIDVTIDTTSAEARKMCLVLGLLVYSEAPGLMLDKWRIRIFSPYGDRPLASCPLSD